MSGTLYMAGEEHVTMLNEMYCLFSHTNPMHSDVFPSVRQMEAEVVAMTASILGGERSPGLLLPSCLALLDVSSYHLRSGIGFYGCL